MCAAKRSAHRPSTLRVPGSRWEVPGEIAHERDHVRLVQRARHADEIAERLHRPLAHPGEALRRVGRFEGTPLGQPPRRREVVEGHHRHDATLLATSADASVVIERGGRELTLGRLDPAPFDGETVRTQPKPRDQFQVLRPTVPGVAGVAARLDTRGVGIVFVAPPVVVDVAALDLMRGCRGTPDEAVGEALVHHGSRVVTGRRLATASTLASGPARVARSRAWRAVATRCHSRAKHAHPTGPRPRPLTGVVR